MKPLAIIAMLALTGCTSQFTGPVIINVMADGNTFEQLAETLSENSARTDLRKDAAP